MRVQNKKGQLEFSFAWLFAIIVGAAIIFLAIYATTNIVSTEKSAQNVEAGKQFGILLSPIETGLESAKVSVITFPTETRLINECDTMGSFGHQYIGVAIKSGIGEAWQSSGVRSAFQNKYMFSLSTTQGTNFNVFAKPFNMPFKVADLIYVWTGEYCFVNPTPDIRDEIESLNAKGINITDNIANCKRDSIKVCFQSVGCDVDVSTASKSVKKDKKTLYYEDSLVYGAIFADPKVYGCQVKRLMDRTSELSLLYLAKSQSLSPKGCSSNLEGDLGVYSNQTAMLNNSLDLRELEPLSTNLEERNNALLCKLF